ncbi:DUF2188 domain-containing protein [Paenibacillus sp. Marseille-Q4541]|uniref:DUF2188 domain-containing protein n=1 Tax=Paenibacillus sp. Marseille-Q4541 TaxID=2831522 RepID=UPI001BA8744C|nr:DUF2188 domain-containing protein [Paenibacillus sp. Marseille-Q4541]
MTKKGIFTTKRGDQWANIIGSNQRASGIFDTQRQAIDAAKDRAKRDGLEHTIQGKDGKFREKNSYGNDPRNIKG